ncbi:MAG: sigma-54-dependent Fis family transcriptional regulator, partial [Deltaproteobacteria bacterium]|nr:sigma-54-dependent Fis family transcriptional regulator [Nannocystaceae bacterium]
LALSSGGVIDADALGDPAPVEPGDTADPGGPLRDRVAAFERGIIEAALRDAGGNHSEAARKLVVSRVTLLDKIRRYGLR